MKTRFDASENCCDRRLLMGLPRPVHIACTREVIPLDGERWPYWLDDIFAAIDPSHVDYGTGFVHPTRIIIFLGRIDLDAQMEVNLLRLIGGSAFRDDFIAPAIVDGHVAISFDRDDLVLLNNCLNELLNGFDDVKFLHKLGFTRNDAFNTHQAIRLILNEIDDYR